MGLPWRTIGIWIFVTGLVAIAIWEMDKDHMVTVKGFKYNVGDESPKDSGKLLHKLNETAVEVIRVVRQRLEEHEDNSRPMDYVKYRKLKEMYELLRHNYNPDGLQETVHTAYNSDQTSYTYGKGEILSLCINYNGKREPWAVLFLVLVHEMAHMATTVRHHPPEFWEVYRLLMEVVAESGMTRSIDIPDKGHMYCGNVYLNTKEFERLRPLMPETLEI